MVQERSQIELHHPSEVYLKLLGERYAIKSKQMIAVLSKMWVHLFQQPLALRDAQEEHQKLIVMRNYREFYLPFLSSIRE